MFDKLFEAIIGGFVVGLIASLFFGDVVVAIAAAVGIVGIGAAQLAGFTAFVIILIYGMVKKKKDEDSSE